MDAITGSVVPGAMTSGEGDGEGSVGSVGEEVIAICVCVDAGEGENTALRTGAEMSAEDGAAFAVLSPAQPVQTSASIANVSKNNVVHFI